MPLNQKDDFWKNIFKNHVFTYFNGINLALFLWLLQIGQIKNGLFIVAVLFSSFMAIYHSFQARIQLRKLEVFVEEQYELATDPNRSISRAEIQKGDQLCLHLGQQIPSDGLLLEGNLEVDESYLTGEKEEVSKVVHDKLMGGSFVVSGSGVFEASCPSTQSHMEQFLSSTKSIQKKKMGLEKDLDKLIRILSFVLLPIGLAIYFKQIKVSSYSLAVLSCVAAMIGMIPEGLIVLTSMSKMIGALRLSRVRVLTQNLSALENLARVDTLCLDKTGTITTGNLRVKEIQWIGESYEEELAVHMSQESYPNFTQQALLNFLGHREQILDHYLSFSSKRKYSASFQQGTYFYVGSNESLAYPALPVSLQSQQEEGMRILSIGKGSSLESSEVIGYVLLEDELKPGLEFTLAYLKQEKVDLRFISGDNEKTVLALAKKAGLSEFHRSGNTTEEIHYDWQVFGRVRPEQKQEIIAHLQKEGHVVAMVGDGVNDVAALRQADVSISFAKAHGAAKQIADIVFLENDFSKVPYAIEEGRRIIHSISNSATLYFIKTMFTISFTILLFLLPLKYPFAPIQLTLLSAFGVGLPSFLLQWEAHPEPLNPSFFRKAIYRAIPAALNIVLGYLVLAWIHQEDWIILYTALVYLVTLAGLYPPTTWLRKVVLVGMTFGYFLAFTFLWSFFQLGNPMNLLKDTWMWMVILIVQGLYFLWIKKGRF